MAKEDKEPVFERKPFTAEELNELAVEIQAAHLAEIEARGNLADEMLDKDELESETEDAYLANFKKIKLAKLFNPEQYVEYELEKQCGCKHEDLKVLDYVEYKS